MGNMTNNISWMPRWLKITWIILGLLWVIDIMAWILLKWHK